MPSGFLYGYVYTLLLYIYKKRGASPVTRSTVERPSHCPDCRNEQRQYNVKSHATFKMTIKRA